LESTGGTKLRTIVPLVVSASWTDDLGLYGCSTISAVGKANVASMSAVGRVQVKQSLRRQNVSPERQKFTLAAKSLRSSHPMRATLIFSVTPGKRGLDMDGTVGAKANNNECEELSDAEKTRSINEILDYEFPPEVRDRIWTDREIMEAESPSHLMDDPPYSFRFPDQIELNAQGIYETMYDTLPEMAIILANECIL
jgi:hypothetical protein